MKPNKSKTLVLAGLIVTLLSGVAAAQADEGANKALVERLYSEVFNGGQTAAADEIIAADAVQHGAEGLTGPGAQLAAFDALKARMPGATANVVRVSADGDWVAVQWHATATPENMFSGEEWADIYRVADGKIVEQWSTHEPIPAESVSGNDPFADLYVYADGVPTPSDEQEAANRAVAEAAAAAAFQGPEAIDLIWGDVYWQHNPSLDNGRDAFKAMVAQFAAMAPPPGAGDAAPAAEPAPTPPMIAEGDLVWVTSYIGPNRLLVDIYRIVDGRLVEHWEVQPEGGFGGPPAN